MMLKFKSNIKDKISGVYNNTRLTYLEKTEQADALLAEDLKTTQEVMIQAFQVVLDEIREIKRDVTALQEAQPKILTEFTLD